MANIISKSLIIDDQNNVGDTHAKIKTKLNVCKVYIGVISQGELFEECKLSFFTYHM